MTPSKLIAALLSLTVAWVVAAGLRKVGPRLGLVDVPNHRSSHSRPRPRGGGLAILAGSLAGVWWATTNGAVPASGSRNLLVAVLLLAGTGLIDDVRGLPAWPRLLAQLAAALIVVLGPGRHAMTAMPLPPPLDVALGPASTALSVLWLLAVANFFNFMDGIDGLAGGQAMIVLAAAATIGWSPRLDFVILSTLAAVLGFLFHNWAPSRVFMGDVGSIPLGFLIAALPLHAPADCRGAAVLATALAMAMFLFDPVATLLVRWRAGHPPGQAHRDHAYQRLTRAIGSHAAVAVLILSLGSLLAAAAIGSYRRPSAWLALAVAGLVCGLFWRLCSGAQVESRLWPARGRRSLTTRARSQSE